MTDENNYSLINLGKLSKPMNTFVEKVSNAVGGIFAPYQVKRMAKAEAAAAIIRTQSDIDVSELKRRALNRFVQEQATRQENIESITRKAIPEIKDNANPEGMDNDWITNFFDKSRIVSDDEMQNLWAKVLAGEANSPGKFSKRTVNFLSDLDKSDAEKFTSLCAFGLQMGDVVPLVFNAEDEIYLKNGVSFATLSHLDSIGLVQFNNVTGFRLLGLPRRFSFFYGAGFIPMVMPKEEKNELEVGHALLTKMGQELAPLCGSKPVDGFIDYIRQKWSIFTPKEIIVKATAVYPPGTPNHSEE